RFYENAPDVRSGSK
ncbi:hypothetical protein VCHC17A1_0260B, partial [Vibrio cholerae HC-17A1]